MELPHYDYRFLGKDEIRILVLEAGHFDDELHGRLEEISLAKAAAPHSSDEDDKDNDVDAQRILDTKSDAYEAISYAWGPAVFRHCIGVDGYAAIQITASLDQALRQFRYKDRHRRLWADALCINQADHHEKAIQVAKMGSIYEGAARTLVWLGLGAGLDWLAFGALRYLMRFEDDDEVDNVDVASLGEALVDLPQDCPCCPQLVLTSGFEAVQTAARGLSHLCDRSWFSRLWVLQEYSLSHHLRLCSGSHTVSGSCLWHLCQWQATHREVSPFRQVDTDVTLSVFNLNLQEGRFVDLLRKIATRTCSDPRDRIFSIRALCEAQEWTDGEPDYTVDPDTLFSRAVLRCLADRGVNDYLKEARLAIAPLTKSIQDRECSLPSWVPNLQNMAGSHLEFVWQRYSNWSNLEGDGGKMQPRTGRSSTEIKVSGIRCGTIQRLLSNSQIETTGRSEKNRSVFSVHHIYPDKEKLLAWICYCSRFFQSHKDRDHISINYLDLSKHGDYRNSRRDIAYMLNRLEKADDEFVVDESEDVTDSDEWAAAWIGTGRLLSVVQTSSSCKFGWVPENSRADDELFILSGCLWPFVLRRIPNQDACRRSNQARCLSTEELRPIRNSSSCYSILRCRTLCP